MGFFDADLPPVPEETGGHVLYAPAEGASYGVHARDYVVPAVLPWVRRLGVGPDVQVWLRRVDVWPGGFSLELGVFRRIVRASPSLGPAMRDDPAALRIGLVMGDGTRATSVGRGYPLPAPPDDAGKTARSRVGIALMARSSGIHHTSYHAEVPLLPPEGPVAVVVEWPAEQLPETRTELDGKAIRDAADDAVEVWPDLPRRPEGPHGAHVPRLAYYTAAPHLVGGIASPVPVLPPAPLLPSPYSAPPYPPPFPMPPYPDAMFRPEASPLFGDQPDPPSPSPASPSSPLSSESDGRSHGVG
ncbi:hypothetical protein OG216_06355 [Streptomycetaceae bacterium NBC_01309]